MAAIGQKPSPGATARATASGWVQSFVLRSQWQSRGDFGLSLREKPIHELGVADRLALFFPVACETASIDRQVDEESQERPRCTCRTSSATIRMDNHGKACDD